MAWRPSASLATLQLRARLLARVRAFFAARGVLEVETPTLSRAGSTDPALTSLTTRVAALGGTQMFLHTSPEFAMKRLLAAGSGDIYQICRVFRDDEVGRWHEPEFTLLEWYRVGWDDLALMDEVGALLTEVLACERARPAMLRMSYCEALQQYVGVDPTASVEVLEAALEGRGLAVPTADRRALLDFALSAAVAPALPRSTVTFIYDFPADQAALARIKPTTPAVAARFEAYFDGIELANGFAELTDAGEQRRRFEAEHAARLTAAREVPPLDEALLAALEHGLPECAGVAVGIDRLVAAAASIGRIHDVVSFAHGEPDSRPRIS